MPLVGFKKNSDRPKDDFYPTPESATRAMLAHIHIPEDVTILEPSCGDGAISKILEETHTVISRDLENHGYGEIGQDFLKTTDWPEGRFWIITNPPYNIANDYVRKCLASPAERVILLLKWDYSGGSKSREGILNIGKIQRVLLMKERVSFWPKGKERKGSPSYYSAWYIWDKRFTSDNPDEYMVRRISLKDGENK